MPTHLVWMHGACTHITCVYTRACAYRGADRRTDTVGVQCGTVTDPVAWLQLHNGWLQL